MWNIAIYFIILLYSTSLAHGAKILGIKNKEPGLNVDLNNRWPQGRIYYYVDGNFSITNRVQEAFRTISGGRPCPHFTQLLTPPETPTFGATRASTWLHFTNTDGARECVHKYNPDAYGEIKVNVGYDCIKPPQLLHTIMHALGFPDEVSHPQRDLFVNVQWENIQPAYSALFRVRSMDDKPLLDYDAKSIMHFHDRAYSLNGQATIAPLLPGLIIEPATDLSHIDKMKLRLMFDHECKKRQIGNLLHNCGQLDPSSNSHEDPDKNSAPENDSEKKSNDDSKDGPDSGKKSDDGGEGGADDKKSDDGSKGGADNDGNNDDAGLTGVETSKEKLQENSELNAEWTI